MNNIKIFSCRQREKMARTLCGRLMLTAGDIIFDSRSSQNQSFCYEVSMAWERFDVSNLSGWSMLIQEDCEICDGFIDIVGQIMTAHPNTVFSFIWIKRLQSTRTIRFGKQKLLADAVLRFPTNILVKWFNICVGKNI